MLIEVNSNFENLKSPHLGNVKIYEITTSNEFLEWEYKKKIEKNTL